MIREVYNDWSAQRGTLSDRPARHRGHRAAAVDQARLIEKRYAVAGKQLVQRVKTWLQFPQWFYHSCRSTRWSRRG